MTERQCSEPGCTKPVHGRGLCGTHYKRYWKHGTVELQDHRERWYQGVPRNCPLTTAQLEVIRAYARGRTTGQIAFARGTASTVVHTHRHAAARRLGVINLPQTILVCQQNGWLDIEMSATKPHAELTKVQRDYVLAFTALIQTSPTARDRLLEGLMSKSESEIAHPPLRLVE